MELKERRLIFLDAKLRQTRGHTKAELLEMVREENLGPTESGISENTLSNDFKELKTRTGGVIELRKDPGHPKRPRLRYQRPLPDELDNPYFKARHLRALWVASAALATTQAIPEAEDLRELATNLEQFMADQGQSLPKPRVEQILHFQPSPLKPVDPEIWRTLCKAVENHRRVSFIYERPWKKDRTYKKYTVRPHRIVNLQGEWHLLATLNQEELDVRQFHLSRMSKMTLGHVFPPPNGLNIEERLAHIRGNLIGDPGNSLPVTLRFKPDVYPLVAGHRFHPDQRLVLLGDDRLELTFSASTSASSDEWIFYNLRRWVLSFGPYCEVVGPPLLREKIAKDLRRMLVNLAEGDPLPPPK